mgnify:CR=1 FL=1
MTEKVKEPYTIILGAEGGLGREIARQVAGKKCNLILVSTTSIDLQRFAIGLQLKEEVQVEACRLKLSDHDSIRRFSEEVRDKYEIRALINNIACDWTTGGRQSIGELAGEDFMTRFRGTALLTWSLLSHMTALSSSYIQHIIPFPFRKEQITPEMKQSASKMYAFARELEEELKPTSISVSIVHPAPLRSTEELSTPAESPVRREPELAPSMVALKAVNGMLRGDRLIIPGFRNRVQFFLNRQATGWFRSTRESLETNLQPSV